MMDKNYYHTMLERERLIPFFDKDRLVCFLTFYIGNEADTDKFVRDDMWQAVDDSSDGDVCFIDHLIADKLKVNAKLSYDIWHRFKVYIKSNFPRVKIIRWNKFNKITGEVRTYKKEI